jgi:hypothetical protein
MHSRFCWGRFIRSRDAILCNILLHCRKRFLEALNVEVAGAEITGGGYKAAIGWDVVDVCHTVETSVCCTVISLCFVMGEKFGEEL